MELVFLKLNLKVALQIISHTKTKEKSLVSYEFLSEGIDLAGGPLWQIIMPHPLNEG